MYDSYDVMMALTLVSMQGLINRNGPRVYLDYLDPSWNVHPDSAGFWIPVLEKHVHVNYLYL